MPGAPPPPEPPMRAAWRLARALGCNIMPTDLDRHPHLKGWPGWGLPDSPRQTREVEMMTRWRDRERRSLDAGREEFAWAILPGSGRITVIDCDGAGWLDRWLERQPTPLVVRSPTPGRGHAYYRWPDGVDLSSRDNVAGPKTYEVKARGKSIHAPGSLHWTRTGRYVCSLPPEEQVEGLRDQLPALDLALVEEDARSAPGRAKFDEWRWGEDKWDETGEGARRWAKYMAASPPQTQGGRQQALLRHAMRAADFGQTVPQARPLLTQWALACTPPLTADEAHDVLLRAYRSRNEPIGCALMTPTIEVDV